MSSFFRKAGLNFLRGEGIFDHSRTLYGSRVLIVFLCLSLDFSQTFIMSILEYICLNSVVLAGLSFCLLVIFALG